MSGAIGKNKADSFSLDNYEEFYEDEHFQPVKEKDVLNINEIIPRFGWAYDQIEVLQPNSLLDVGCLDGSFAICIANAFDIPVAGIDLTKGGIELARERQKKFGILGSFYQGSAEEELRGFEANAFDVVTMFEIIEHVKDPQVLIEEVDRVLAPGGSVLLSTPAFESPVFGADDEKNKCHIRLYTTAEEDYEAVNKHGNTRKATSLIKEIGKDRIKEIGVFSHLIHARYQ